MPPNWAQACQAFYGGHGCEKRGFAFGVTGEPDPILLKLRS